MSTSFSWRHALALLAIVCLLSIVAGAVLAQDEPELPEPDVPVFDLSGSAAEPAQEPDSPPAANPFVVIEPAVVTDEPSNLVPADGSIVTTENVNFSANLPAGATGLEAEVYQRSDMYFNELTGEWMPFPGVTPLTPTTATAPASLLQPQADAGSLALVDGIAYVWQVRGTDGVSSGPWAQALFTIDVPEVSPTLTDTVITTTPLVTWPETSGADWYNVVAVAGDINGNYVVGWNNWYPNVDKSYPSLGLAFEGICENGQCKVRPETELTQDLYTGEILIGNVPVQIYAATFSETTLTLSDYALVTEFIISAPQVSVTPDGGVTPGRPNFTATRPGQTVDEILPAQVNLLGVTETIYPDFIEIYLLDADTFAFVGSEWYYVANGGATSPCLDGGNPAPCELEAFDGLQELLYNGNYLYAARGYSSLLDGYTPYALGPGTSTFTIDEDPPTADSLAVAGIYEYLGDDDFGSPFGLTDTWVPCATEGCDSTRPYFHIAVNQGSFSGDWIGIAIVNDDLSFIYFNYFNVNDFFGGSGYGEYWNCGFGFGGGFFDFTSCFFRPGVLPEDGGMFSGDNYTIYVGSYGPGGASTGGTFGFTTREFSTLASDPVENLAVDLEGLTATTFTSADFPGFTETLFTGVPKFSWNDQPTALFYEVEIVAAEDIGFGSVTFYNTGDTVYGPEWLIIGSGGLDCQNIGGSDICAFQYLDAPWLPNGNYTAIVNYYDGGYSQDATLNFTIDAPPPAAPLTNTMSVYIDEQLTGTVLPIFEWVHQQGNDFYNLQVFDDAGTPLLGVDYTGDGLDDGLWYAASDICGIDFAYVDSSFNSVYQIFCQVDLFDYLLESFDSDAFLLEGTYTWQVNSFGPGDPNDSVKEGPIATFTLAGADTTEPQPLYPTYRDSGNVLQSYPVTYTNAPTFYWEASDNASWYQVYVGRNVGQALGEIEYETYIFGYFYRPIATDDGDIEAYFENGIQPCYANHEPIVVGEDENGFLDFMSVDPDTIVCELRYSPNGNPIRYYNDPLLANDPEFEWFVQPLGGGEADIFGNWATMGSFPVNIGPSAPVWHGGDFFDFDTFTFYNGMEGNFQTLNGGLYEDLNTISFEAPKSDRYGTETLAYIVTIYDTASNQPVFVDVYFPSDLGCGPFDDFCLLSLADEDVQLSPYGVYEVEVAVIGQGEIDWSDPDNLKLKDPGGIIYPPANGSYGPPRAKFTKL